MAAPDNPPTHEILILGGNLGGVSAAHYLLRNVLPALHRAADASDLGVSGPRFTITILSPNTDMYYKPASPRASAQPALMPEARLWRPLAAAFAPYGPGTAPNLVRGVAAAVDPRARTVTARDPAGRAPDRALRYDTLVVATGTTSASPLWGLQSDQGATPAAYAALQRALAAARTVLVAGGGAVGVEMAGELACATSAATVVLLSGGHRLLPRAKEAVGKAAEAYLTGKLAVEVVHGLTVTATEGPKAPEMGSTVVSLSDGSKREVDLYVDATGGQPNSDFLPRDWLDESGRVILRDGYFRARGLKNADEAAQGVYAIGDIVAGSANSLMELEAVVPTAMTALGLDLARTHKLHVPERLPWPQAILGTMGLVETRGKTLVQKEFKPMKDTMLVPIGTDGGVGVLFGWSLPSFFVKMVKGRDFLISMYDPIVSGEKW